MDTIYSYRVTPKVYKNFKRRFYPTTRRLGINIGTKCFTYILGPNRPEQLFFLRCQRGLHCKCSLYSWVQSPPENCVERGRSTLPYLPGVKFTRKVQFFNIIILFFNKIRWATDSDSCYPIGRRKKYTSNGRLWYCLLRCLPWFAGTVPSPLMSIAWAL